MPWPVTTLSDGTRNHAWSTFVCNGSCSEIQTSSGGDWPLLWYDQEAVVANVRATGTGFTALQRWVCTEPVSIPPVALADRSLQARPLASVLWTTTSAEAKSQADLDDVGLHDKMKLVLFSHEYGTGGNEKPPHTSLLPKDQLLELSETSSWNFCLSSCRLCPFYMYRPWKSSDIASSVYIMYMESNNDTSMASSEPPFST